MNCCKLVNLLAVLSAGALHAESTFAAEAPGWEKEVVQQANQQKNVVTGTVLDENGFSVPGASVMVVGTTDGTVTDMDGVYSLSLSRKKAVLRFSFIGLKSVDVEYTGQKTLNVVLKSDNQVLDDVVVIGYGSKNRKSLTSSISSVKKEDLNKLSKTSSTVQDMLGGTIKGVLVTQNSGEPGATMTVNVRGITSPYPIATSLTANNAPLYVIDGVPMFVESAGEYCTERYREYRRTEGCFCYGYLRFSWCEWCYYRYDQKRTEGREGNGRSRIYAEHCQSGKDVQAAEQSGVPLVAGRDSAEYDGCVQL